jgi:hypothetical protein
MQVNVAAVVSTVDQQTVVIVLPNKSEMWLM